MSINEALFIDSYFLYANKIISNFVRMYKVTEQERDDFRQYVLFHLCRYYTKQLPKPDAKREKASGAFYRTCIYNAIKATVHQWYQSKTTKKAKMIMLSIQADADEKYDGQVDVILENDLLHPINHNLAPDYATHRKMLIEDIQRDYATLAHPDVASIISSILSSGDRLNECVIRLAAKRKLSPGSLYNRWRMFQALCAYSFSSEPLTVPQMERKFRLHLGAYIDMKGDRAKMEAYAKAYSERCQAEQNRQQIIKAKKAVAA